MPLTLEQKSNVRRHLEFAIAGLPVWSPASGSLGTGNEGYRFLEAMGQLENRLNRLDGNEEARLTGLCLGGVAIVGPQVTAGLVYTLIVSGGGLSAPETITYTTVQFDTQQTAVANLAALCNADTVLAAAGFVAFSPFGYGAFSGSIAAQTPGIQTGSVAIPIAQFSLTNLVPFTLAVSASAGTSLILTASGGHLAPMSTVDPTPSTPVVVYGYLPILDYLEGAQIASTQNLDTSIAGGGSSMWTARNDEPQAREALYRQWVKKMHMFLFGRASGIGSFGMGGGSGRVSGFTL